MVASGVRSAQAQVVNNSAPTSSDASLVTPVEESGVHEMGSETVTPLPK